MSKKFGVLAITLVVSFLSTIGFGAEETGVWGKFETSFRSSKTYENPLYDVESFIVHFTSPTGREKNIRGFWDGGTTWRVRFMPDEVGAWTYITECSDEENTGLHQVTGSFECTDNTSHYDMYTHGEIIRPPGSYHLTYSDGTPFFYTACTAWNGALKSTGKEWDTYLQNRVDKGFNTIQFVTTQWRGGESNRFGQEAFQGSGRIRLNVEFFQHLDTKVDRVNDCGLVAAPVLLWALPFGQGMELSPGYYLPEREAILLARYMVARYGGNHVIWILGGDGRYVESFEQRWKNIGRGVFGDEHAGVVAQHPHGRSWIGNAYTGEDWLDIYGYQSSHSRSQGTVDWINKGPVSENWHRIAAKPVINLEPCYEEIHFEISAEDVRNASYWSLMNAPAAGITYGHNGIWPWLREGEEILNHRHEPGVTPWYEAIHAPGSAQIGYLAEFFQQFEWWNLRPDQSMLAEQPGDTQFNHFISVTRTEDYRVILAYVPVKSTVKLYNLMQYEYEGQWFDPVENTYSHAQVIHEEGILRAASPKDQDLVLILRRVSSE
ncbi:MAG TPA: DUF4038 domain-containing protein [bacterium]|nr:DUF4038 domain-containing protein [bacterium]